MRKTFLLIFTNLSIVFVFGQIVNIPDVNFKAALIANPSINTNSDSEIQVAEANSYSSFINVNSNVSDLTGIEAFTSITTLQCVGTQITSLDLSGNVALKNVYCRNNLITSINLTNTLALEVLDCSHNPLVSLDLSDNLELVSLICNSTQISNLDLSNNVNIISLDCENSFLNNLSLINCNKLKYLHLNNNFLTNLDLSTNIDLWELYCANNNIISLNLSGNTELWRLVCNDNSLTSLNVTGCVSLAGISCNNNNITNLDLTTNTSLYSLNCSDNQLSTLNIKNGINTLMSDTIYITNNPNLFCIGVDDDLWATTMWVVKDSWASYSVNCTTTGLNDVKNERSISQVFPNPATNTLKVKINASTNAQKIEIFDVSGKPIERVSSKKVVDGLEFDVGSLDVGIYFLKIKDNENATETLKFIKQ